MAIPSIWHSTMLTNSSTIDEMNEATTNNDVPLAIAVITAFLFFLFICLCCYRTKSLDQEHNRILDHMESATYTYGIRRLNTVAPSRTYKQWKDETEGASTPAKRSSSYLVCVICMETLRDIDMIRHLPCGHIFHARCLAKWFLKQHDTCPLCKFGYLNSFQGTPSGIRMTYATFGIP